LIEQSVGYWSSAELIDIINLGIKDLWRDTVDLKQEHFLTIDNTNVSLAANTATLSGVPIDVHKVYLIEPRDVSATSTNRGLKFDPLDYNHRFFQAARSMAAIDPVSATVYYAITGQGSPVGAPSVRIAPQITSAVDLSFAYVPTQATLTAQGIVPIPGEADGALIAWTVAFARAKEQDDRSPDANWITIYGTEKQHLLQSLGLRQYQEPTYVDAMFEEYWG
jgi:hypothetical protein